MDSVYIRFVLTGEAINGFNVFQPVLFLKNMRNVANLRACSTRIIIRNPCPNKKFDISSINSSLVTSPVAFTIGHLFTEERKLKLRVHRP